MRSRHIPLRTCVGCLRKRPKHELVRFVMTADGISVGNVGGRGLYLCRNMMCFNSALKRKDLRKVLSRSADSTGSFRLRHEVLGEAGRSRRDENPICLRASGGGSIA